MSQAQAPMVPTLFDADPSALSTGTNFYTFYGMKMGPATYLSYTYFTGSWGKGNITGPNSALPSGPAPVQDTDIQSIQVGAVTCVVYLTGSASSQLAILTSTAPNAFEHRATYSASRAIDGYCLLTNGAELYFITNEGGTLYYHMLNGDSVEAKVKMNNGAQGNAPVASSTSPLGAIVYNGNIFCSYCGDGEHVYTVFQISGGWDYSKLMDTPNNDNYRSFELYERNSKLYQTWSDYNGEIFVGSFKGGSSNDWGEVYSSFGVATVPKPASKAAVGQTPWGVFISYKDLNGGLQCIYYLDAEGAWNNVQIGGPGASDYFDPSAPASVFDPVVTVFNNFVYHAIYNTGGSNAQIYDVFWAFRWNGTSLYPSTPSLELDADHGDNDGAAMFE